MTRKSFRRPNRQVVCSIAELHPTGGATKEMRLEEFVFSGLFPAGSALGAYCSGRGINATHPKKLSPLVAAEESIRSPGTNPSGRFSIRHREDG